MADVPLDDAAGSVEGDPVDDQVHEVPVEEHVGDEAVDVDAVEEVDGDEGVRLVERQGLGRAQH